MKTYQVIYSKEEFKIITRVGQWDIEIWQGDEFVQKMTSISEAVDFVDRMCYNRVKEI